MIVSSFAKIGESVSNTTIVGAGTPQGTVSGPNDFELVISRDVNKDNFQDPRPRTSD